MICILTCKRYANICSLHFIAIFSLKGKQILKRKYPNKKPSCTKFQIGSQILEETNKKCEEERRKNYQYSLISLFKIGLQQCAF